MAEHLWPKAFPRLTDSEAEKKLYEALKSGLPTGWHCWHSMRLRSKSSGQFDEADFVFADPKRPSVLVVEVKGGLIELQDGQWLQNGRFMKSRPLDEAFDFKSVLVERIKALNLRPPSIGGAICFPNTASEHGPKGEGLDGLVISLNDLPYLQLILPQVMERAVPKPKIPSRGWIEALHKLWGETWVPSICLGGRVELDEDRRLKLDLEQTAILENLEDNDRLLVRGSAGTGKTLLAREAALRESGRRKRVLLLCYTDALGECLKSACQGSAITVGSVRTFASELLGEKGMEKPAGTPSEYWETVSIRAAIDGLPQKEDRWDCVIVDEGQDLSPDDWELVKECVSPAGMLWVFADESQAFWEDRKIPDDITGVCMKFTLKKPYRCHPAVQHLSECYARQAEPDPKILQNGLKKEAIRVVTSSGERLLKQIGKEIERLLAGGLSPGDIAVISLRGKGSKETVIHEKTISGHPVVSATDPEVEGKMICDTFLRFKGLERPAVIVTDLSVSNQYQKRMHIAVSRALSLIRIVGLRDELEADPLLQPLL